MEIGASSEFSMLILFGRFWQLEAIQPQRIDEFVPEIMYFPKLNEKFWKIDRENSFKLNRKSNKNEIFEWTYSFYWMGQFIDVRNLAWPFDAFWLPNCTNARFVPFLNNISV